MDQVLLGKRIALLATDGFEDSELTKPLEALKEVGAEVDIVSIDEGEITGKEGTQIVADYAAADVVADSYHGLLLPGGTQNPDTMRLSDDAVEFVREFFETDKPVAAICHAPWLLVEADVVRERTLTSWPSLKTDLVNAGANWVDEEVVVDQGLVTSRKPDDLPVFCEKMIEEFAKVDPDI